ncbi:AMP-binding protein [Nocardia sp. CA-290969]|uniref:AMP-binding protein n=1 Tax=Nocardia sp. CA-290969 TaxID=3239986 RepID=UPI003D940D2B
MMRVVSGAVEYLVWRHRADDRPCVADRRREWTYREFAERIDAAAAQLAAVGLRRGSVIAIRMSNSLELLVVLMAVWRLGAVAAPMDAAADRNRVENEIRAVGAVLVLDDLPLPSLPRRRGGIPCLSVESLARRAPAGWIAPPGPGVDDIALVYVRARGSSACEEISHADLGLLAWQTVRHLDLTAAAVCSIALSLVRADVIAMNFLPAILTGARVRLVSDGWCSLQVETAGPALKRARLLLAEKLPGPVENLVS